MSTVQMSEVMYGDSMVRLPINPQYAHADKRNYTGKSGASCHTTAHCFLVKPNQRGHSSIRSIDQTLIPTSCATESRLAESAPTLGCESKESNVEKQKGKNSGGNPSHKRGNIRVFDEKYYNKTRGLQKTFGLGFGKGQFANPRGSMCDGEMGIELMQIETKGQLGSVIKTTVQNLNLDCVKPQRAGVILYTVVNGATYFGLGLDARTHDLTDFGGGVIYKTDQNVIRGALREFDEETLQIFNPVTLDEIKQCPVIYDENNLIIFIHVNVDPNVACKTFNDEYEQIIKRNEKERQENSAQQSRSQSQKIRDPEVCAITWLTWEDFQRSMKERGVMFSRVQRFLNKAEDFSYLL